MNRERARELLPIIQAYAEGKEIQYKLIGVDQAWGGEKNDYYTWDNECEYRIKPEPREFWISVAGHMEVHDERPIALKGDYIHVREVLDDE